MVPSYALPRSPSRRRSVRRRRRLPGSRSLFAFLLVACFGILFAGCGGATEPEAEEFAFTEEDIAKVRELVMGSDAGSAASAGPHLISDTLERGPPPTLDLTVVDRYDAMRSGPGAVGDNLYRVTNAFLNVRSSPRVTADQVERFSQGDVLEVLDFVDAAWAKVRLKSGREGYVAQRYIARMVSEDRLPEEKAKFAGIYFVNFGFLNVRKDPDTGSERIGEFPSQALVKPLSLDEVWARVPFEGSEGYVAVEYLKPFLPTFLVRQHRYTLPILHYALEVDGMEDALILHIAALKQEGVDILTLRDFRELLYNQEERDVRLEPRSVVLALSDVTVANAATVSDVLRASAVKATIFLRTMDVSGDGLSDQQLLTLVANGHDVQSAGHTGDDLRSLTNAQVELELKQSRQILEQKTGRPVFAVLYPLGGVNGRIEGLAAEGGYLLGVGSGSEHTFERSQFLRLPGTSVTKSMSEEDVVAIAVGSAKPPAPPQ